jgi:hypothetical protein
VPTASATASIHDPPVGEECWKFDLEAASARNLHLESVVARIQQDEVAATRKVARLLEILPIVSQVPGYSSLLVNYRGMGSMDHSMRWNEETLAVDHMETSHTT